MGVNVHNSLLYLEAVSRMIIGGRRSALSFLSETRDSKYTSYYSIDTGLGRLTTPPRGYTSMMIATGRLQVAWRAYHTAPYTLSIVRSLCLFRGKL